MICCPQLAVIEADCSIVADCRTFAIADDREGMYRKRMADGANRGKSARVCVYDSITIPFGSGMLWNGMEWKMVWNGGEFWYGIWNMLRIEWKGRFEKWNGSLSSILAY